MEDQKLIGFKNNPAYQLVIYTVLATVGTFGVKQIVDAAKCGKLEEITISTEKPIINGGHPSDKYDAGVNYQAVFTE